MTMMKNEKYIFYFHLILPIAVILTLLAGCSKARNPFTAQKSNCTASDCHLSTSLKQYPPSTGKHTKHLDRELICENCHSNYLNAKTHKNMVRDASTEAAIVHFDSLNPNADWNNSTGDCSSLSCHGEGSPPINWYGYFTGCTACHSTGNSIDPVAINGSGTEGKHVKHVSDMGIPCEKCHYNYRDKSSHINTVLDTDDPDVKLVYFDAANPSPGTWANDTGECSSLNCHGISVVEWYGVSGWTLPGCPDCHKSAVGTRRQVFDSNGDGTGTGGDFNKESHHVIDYSARTSQIVTAADCEVCHGMTNHMSGTIRLKDKDNASNVITYNPSNVSSLEPFCLSCHDTDGATTEVGNETSPFISTTILGSGLNQAGNKIKDYWNMLNGHRRKGLTCMGDGFTGCHGNYDTGTQTGFINAHGSGNKGLLANKLELPIPTVTWDETRYKLCFDCHEGLQVPLTKEDILGVADGGNYGQTYSNFFGTYYFPLSYTVDFMVSGFHDYLSYNYDRQFNLHLYHMIKGKYWKYRGDTTTSALSCVSCHNVHGVDGMFYLWDEWNFTIEYDSVTDYTEYGKINKPGSGSNGAAFPVNAYPEFCNNTCHYEYDPMFGDGGGRYPRSPFNEAKAVSSRSSETLVNGDTVTVYFSDSTNAPIISNIDIVLSLSGGHVWGTPTSVVWSNSGSKTGNVLTITIGTGSTIAIGDSIIFDLTTIKDTTAAANPIRGKMTLRGSF